MPNNDLTQYIKTQLDRGVTAPAIEQALKDAGWDQATITESMTAAGGAASSAPAQATPSLQPEQRVDQQPMQQSIQQAAAPSTQPVDMFDDVEPVTQPIAQSPAQSTAPVTQPTWEPATAATTPTLSTETPANVSPIQPVQSLTSTQTTPPTGITMASAKKPHWAKYLIIGVAVMLVIAAIAIGVYAYAQATGSGARKLQLAMNNLVSLKSTSYSIVVAPEFLETSNVTNPLTSRRLSEASIQLTGSVQGLNTATPSSGSIATIKLFGGGGGDTYLGDIRNLGSTTYVQLSDIPGAPAGTNEVLKDQWFSVSAESLAALGNAQRQVDVRLLKPFTQQELNQLKSAIKDSNMVTAGDRAGTENIQGIDTVKYRMTISAQGVEDFASKAKTTLGNHGITEKQLQDFVNTTKQTGDITGFIWIGKKDNQLYQMQFVEEWPQSNGVIKRIAFSITLWDHNREVKIEIPSSVKPLDNLLLQLRNETGDAGGIVTTNAIEEVLSDETTTDTNQNANTNTSSSTNANTNVSASSEETATEASNANTTTTNPDADDDADGLTNGEEEDYGTNPNDSDSDNDGFTDGNEVENDYDPLGPGKLTDDSDESADADGETAEAPEEEV
jgi:hypothetical protein